MSIKMYFEPTDIFLDRIDARSWGSTSKFSSRSTRTILSSEGASPNEPPHAKQAPVLFTTCLIFDIGRSTCVIVSITSAVPAADVIALEDVFGIVNPATAQIAMTIGVVRFPATPPMECLSAIYFPWNFNFAPVCTMALIKSIVSFVDIPTNFSAAVK